jgi:hypothetical protein
MESFMSAHATIIRNNASLIDYFSQLRDNAVGTP